MIMVFVLAVEVLLAALFTSGLALFWLGPRTILRLFKATVPIWLLILFLAYAFQYFNIVDFGDLSPLENRLPPGILGMLWVILEVSVWFAVWIAVIDILLDLDVKTGHLTELAMNFGFATQMPVRILLMGLLSYLLQLFWPWRGQGFFLGLAFFISGLLSPAPVQLFKVRINWKTTRLVWSALWAMFGVSYILFGRWGMLLLSIPALFIYLIYLERFVRHALPITPEQRWSVLRCALTYLMGNNYPFYVIRDWKTAQNATDPIPKPTAPGNPFLQFFGGPGIVLTDCAHAAVLYDGFKYRVAPPGLTFTNVFEQLFAAVDLRPQLRVTTIPAETRDGMMTKTLVFMPHRIATGGQEPKVGTGFPYDEQALLKAVTQDIYVEHSWSRDESGKATEIIKRVPWDELVLMIGPAIFKDALVKYTCNELHNTQNGQRDPRVEIGNEFRTRLRERMRDYGIEMVGGGLSNIVPEDYVIEQRIDNWAARWKKRIEEEMGAAEAGLTEMLEPIWLEAQLSVYRELARILERANDLSEEVVALQLVEALGAIPPHELPEQPKEALSEFVRAMMRRGK